MEELFEIFEFLQCEPAQVRRSEERSSTMGSFTDGGSFSVMLTLTATGAPSRNDANDPSHALRPYDQQHPTAIDRNSRAQRDEARLVRGVGVFARVVESGR